MRVPLTGMGSYQGSPTAESYLVVTYGDRLEDGEGNAAVSQYKAVFNPAAREWRDEVTPTQRLLLVVTLSQTARVQITEVFRYTDRPEVRTEWSTWAVATNLAGTTFDYTQTRPPSPPTGKEPLTMQAARELLEGAGAAAGLSGTQAQRRAYDRSTLTRKTRWDVTEAPYPTYWYTPNDTAWRDSSGNDPDAAPPADPTDF